MLAIEIQYTALQSHAATHTTVMRGAASVTATTISRIMQQRVAQQRTAYV